MKMEEERIPKTVFSGKFHKTSSIRKPRTRWTEYEIREDKLTIYKNGGAF
jgi:hypothetical protein